jgi:hypothetical protein
MHYGRELYRVLYRRSERLVVLLHVFVKRSAKIEERDIRIARERWEDFRARMDAPQRVPPRAAGHEMGYLSGAGLRRCLVSEAGDSCAQ